MRTALSAAWRRLRDVLPDRAALTSMTRDPKRDLLSGLTVALVALPLALGFGVSTGAGAAAGLATAVVAGALAAIFGGSNVQVTGPTGAMTVVLVPIVHQHGIGGVLAVGLLAGLILLALSLARAGALMAYVPVPVIEGFTVGIAGVIALQQIPAALGVATPSGENPAAVAWRAAGEFLSAPHPTAIAVAVGVAAVMLIGARLAPLIPASLVAVALATVVVRVFHLPVTLIGPLPDGLPAPNLGFLAWDQLPSLVLPALAVAALGALESLMSASAADSMSVSARHDPNRELFGQGLANLVAPIFGGVAATGAIARTAVNVRSGAVSRLSSLTHAAVLAAVIYFAGPLVSGIPLAALAGVLIATAVRMVEVGSVVTLIRSGRGDALILVLTAAATIAFDLVIAVITGLLVAAVVAVAQVSRSARVEQVHLHADLPEQDHHQEEHALLAEHIAAYRIEGPLQFAGAHRFLLELSEVADIRVLILRMSHVTAIDATGSRVLADTIDRLDRRGITVLVSGLNPAHRQRLDTLGLLDRLRGQGRVFGTTPDAIADARARLVADGTLT